jgi:cytochrome c5
VRFSLLAVLVFVSGCGVRAPVASPAETLDRAQRAAPADARLAGLYAGACRTCHTTTDSGAPLSLNRAAWDLRWMKGEGVLLNHTVSGYNGMPAGGQCFSCTADDYRALIAFMAGREN